MIITTNHLLSAFLPISTITILREEKIDTKTYVNLEGPIFHKTNSTKSIIFAKRTEKYPSFIYKLFLSFITTGFLCRKESISKKEKKVLVATKKKNT